MIAVGVHADHPVDGHAASIEPEEFRLRTLTHLEAGPIGGQQGPQERVDEIREVAIDGRAGGARS